MHARDATLLVRAALTSRQKAEHAPPRRLPRGGEYTSVYLLAHSLPATIYRTQSQLATSGDKVNSSEELRWFDPGERICTNEVS